MHVKDLQRQEPIREFMPSRDLKEYKEEKFPFVLMQFSVERLSYALVAKEIIFLVICIGLPVKYVENEEIRPVALLFFLGSYTILLLIDRCLHRCTMKYIVQEQGAADSKISTFTQYLLLAIGGMWPFFLSCTVAIISHMRTASAYSSISIGSVLVLCHLVSLFSYKETDKHEKDVGNDTRLQQRILLQRVRKLWNLAFATNNAAVYLALD